MYVATFILLLQCDAIMYVHMYCTQVGVVGRTGAGKSSLFKALFHMVELSVGSISIDGIQISSISLERLRYSASYEL